jgi:hypothetical protein
MVVYKINEFATDLIDRGLVVKQTPKTFIVKCSNHTQVWRKNQCLTSIESASKALIAECKKRLELSRLKSALENTKYNEALKWAEVEEKEIAELNLNK